MNDSSNDEKTIKNEPGDKPANEGKPGKPYGEDISRAAVGRLFDEDAEAKPSQYVKGYGRNTSRRPVLNEENGVSQEAKPSQETRTRSRRATTMLMEGADESELPDSGFTRPRERNRERDRDRDRRRNPEPIPAVRTNVETVRKPEFRHPRDGKDAAPPAESNLDGFRERYNPDELISAPRRRGGPPPRDGVRKPRNPAAPVPLAYGAEPEGLNPLRIVAVVVMIGVLVFMLWLVLRMNGLSNQINEYRDVIADMEYEANTASPSQLELDAMREHRDLLLVQNQELNNQLMAQGIHPSDPQQNQPLGPGAGVGNGEGTEPPDPTPDPPAQQGFPRTVTVQRGDNLSRIVARYYGASPPHSLILYVAAANNLADPFIVQEGQTLTLPPRP